MMTGRLYIDGDDVFKKYGAYVTANGWNALVSWASLKAVESNDWQEEDGQEYDLSAPVLDSREVSLPFAFGGVFSRYYAFVDMLSDGAYHTFRCEHIGREFKLRLVSADSLDIAKLLGVAQFKFADDFPLNGYAYKEPQSSIGDKDDYAIDGRNFTEYGVRVLQGSFSEVVKSASVKAKLLRNIKTQQGAIYDNRADVVFKSKDVKLTCLMRADSLEQLWRNWNALLYDLIRPNERTLYVNELEQEFPCFYKSCSVNAFYPDDRIWLEFSVTLTFTRDFRITEDDLVLAAEDNSIVFTENDAYAFEMMPDKFYYPSMRFVRSNSIRFTSSGAMRFNN